MIVTAIKTGRLSPGAPVLNKILDQFLDNVPEASVLAVTSKIVAICEGRTVPIAPDVDKKKLIAQESDYYLPEYLNNYDFSFTIAHKTLIPSAGIDESNGGGHYILWPKDPRKSANELRRYLQKRFGLKKIGVIITDSSALPLHYGTGGVTIGYSGFSPLNNYAGLPDLFGRTMEVSISNVADSLAAAAVAVMGEGAEQTPLAIIKEADFVEFRQADPSPGELNKFFLDYKNDQLFKPFLKNAGWQKGGRTKN